jgi:hypothetical protein
MSGEHTWSHARAAGVRGSIMAALGVVGLLAGCVVDSTGGGGSGSAGGSGSGGPYGSSSSGGAATQPLHVRVDTGGTLVATPGNGIGVYVEYVTGGHWRVSWTCDSSLTNLSCSYVVDASVGTGTIANPASDGFQGGDSLSQASARQIEAVATTTTGEGAMLFDTTPGVPITLTVSLNAPVSFFFVQENLVNGGWKGALTNPLILEPSAP